MKYILITIGLLICVNVNAKTFTLPYDMQFDISGYLGWKQIISNVDYDSIPSEPEIGITTSLKITNRLNVFNQFKYGTTVDSILVYNQISYTPYIPINDLLVTIRGGKIRYDNTLFNITRINPRTRQGVFQPQSIYWNTLAQTITSGAGIGLDVKYKNFSASYVIDKQTIVNPRKESRAWTTRRFNDIKSKFGDHQIASIQYEFPEENIRLKASWNKSKFLIPPGAGTQIGTPNSNTFGVEYFTAGIEWEHDRWHTSLELQTTKRDTVNWTQSNKLAYGGSATVEYDINNNFTIRANYNAYQSAAVVRLPQEKYNRDLNLGVNWHNGQWMAGVEGHWIQGGRIVDPDAYAANPNDFKSFYVVGMNLVYFFD